MLKKRLIACLLWREGLLVQSVNFQHTNFMGSALTAVDFFNTWAIDEIVLLDVSREPDKRELFHNNLQELSKRCFVPLSVGGWVNSPEEIRSLLSEGADKVIINTAAVKSPDFISQAAKMFGNQCIVVSIDAKITERGYEVFINRGKESAGLLPADWAKKAEEAGAGEIFLTSIDRDGLRNGYDLELTQNVAKAVGIPVIASGGVGDWQHLVDGINAGADAVSAANIFHYSEQSTKKAKNYLKEKGAEVREPEFYHIIPLRQPKYLV